MRRKNFCNFQQFKKTKYTLIKNENDSTLYHHHHVKNANICRFEDLNQKICRVPVDQMRLDWINRIQYNPFYQFRLKRNNRIYNHENIKSVFNNDNDKRL